MENGIYNGGEPKKESWIDLSNPQVRKSYVYVVICTLLLILVLMFSSIRPRKVRYVYENPGMPEMCETPATDTDMNTETNASVEMESVDMDGDEIGTRIMETPEARIEMMQRDDDCSNDSDIIVYVVSLIIAGIVVWCLVSRRKCCSRNGMPMRNPVDVFGEMLREDRNVVLYGDKDTLHKAAAIAGGLQGKWGKFGDEYKKTIIYFKPGDVTGESHLPMLNAAFIKNYVDAYNYADNMFNILRKVDTTAERDTFYTTSGKLILAEAIYTLATFRGGHYCTFPHLITLLMQDNDMLIEALKATKKSKARLNCINPDIVEQYGGQMAEIQSLIARFYNEDVLLATNGVNADFDVDNKKGKLVLVETDNVGRMNYYKPIVELLASGCCETVNTPYVVVPEGLKDAVTDKIMKNYAGVWTPYKDTHDCDKRELWNSIHGDVKDMLYDLCDEYEDQNRETADVEEEEEGLRL